MTHENKGVVDIKKYRSSPIGIAPYTYTTPDTYSRTSTIIRVYATAEQAPGIRKITEATAID
jgi:hypothetical protein